MRTTHPVEFPFAAVWLRTKAAKRFKILKNSTARSWKRQGVVEQAFWGINPPQLMSESGRRGR